MRKMRFIYIMSLLSFQSWILLSVKGAESQVGFFTGSTNTTIVKRSDNIAHAQCADNEFGTNCTYCVPQDDCNAGHYTCDKTTGSKVCLPGYLGTDCLNTSVQGTTDYHVTCPENDCRNNGYCTSGRCCCKRGFAGVLCEIEIIECRNDSCLNGGVCKDFVGHFKCMCKPFYTGDNCEIRADAHALTTPSQGQTCRTTRCLHGGTCFEDMYLPYCLCPIYYTGLNCETDVRSKPIHIFNCPPEYYNVNCTTFCRPQNDCHGHYICDQSTGNKICMSGWHGNKCDTRILPQSLDPACPTDTGCKNDGQCVDNKCCCRHNYTGEFCQIESIGCLSNPCMNNATCFNVGNAFACACVGNYTGQTCDHEIVNIPPATASARPTFSTPSTNNTTNTPPSSANKSSVIDNNISSQTNTPSLSFITPVTQTSFISDSSLSISSLSTVWSDSSNSYMVPTSSATLAVSLVTTSSLVSTSPSLLSFSLANQAISPTSSINPSQTSSTTLATNVDSSSISNSVTSSTLLHPSMSEISSSMISNISFISPLKPSSSSFEITPSSVILSNSGSLSTSTDSRISSEAYISSSMSVSPSLPKVYSSSPNIHSSDITTTPINRSFGASSSSNIEVSSSMSNFDSSSNNFVTGVSQIFTATLDSIAGHSSITIVTNPSKQMDSITKQTNMAYVTKSRTSLSTKPIVQTSVSFGSMSVHSNHFSFGIPTATTVTLDNGAQSKEGISTNWKIALIVLGCVLLLLLLLILIVILTVRQRKKDSMYVSHSPEELHGFSKEHFSVQPNFNNPSFDVGNEPDDDSVKHDIYVVNE